MPNRYRRVKWNNIGTGAKVRIRRSIWLAELQDFGTVTDDAVDLPTSGATHRGPNLGAVSGTRQYVNLSTVNDLTVVDTQDHGLITDNAITAVAWKLNPENTNVVDTSPTYTVTHDAPGGTSVDEGTTVTFTITTTNVADGTQLLHSIQGSHTTGSTFDFTQDISGGGNQYGSQDGSTGYPIGAGLITVNNNTASFQIQVMADAISDGTGVERFKALIHNTDLNGTSFPATKVAETAYITINDTSTSTPAQARDRYLRITGASYNTSLQDYVLDHVDLTSDHPDWTANGMTTDVTLVKAVHHPSNTTLELGDAFPNNGTFTLSTNSAYHTWGLNDAIYSSLQAPNGYHISGFTKDTGNGNYTRWNIDYDNSQFGARASVLDQLFEGQVISNYENTTWLTLYDADGYKYEFSHHRRSTNGYLDQFEYNSTTQAY